MILPPGPHSPLRPIITAFYATLQRVAPDQPSAAYLAVLRRELLAAGQTVAAPPGPTWDLLVADRVGLVWLPTGQALDASTRRYYQRVLRLPVAPPVTLLLTLTPTPRLARLEAPRSRDRLEVRHV